MNENISRRESLLPGFRHHFSIPSNTHSTGIKPFIKWAGGKSQLLSTLRKIIPTSFKKYYEPFLGGGALFFDQGFSPAYLADSNPELMNCYRAVRNQSKKLIKLLSTYQISEKEYYRIRSLNPSSLSNLERAVRFIYLNKTCYNGLYRVNKKGLFNTPFGHCKKVKIVDSDNLLKASSLLRKAELRCTDYYDLLIENARKGDFVYFDPPYLPLGGYSDFKRYTKNFFYEEDHINLASLFDKLDERGCLLLLSNSSNKKIVELYKGYNIKTVKAQRFINCKGDRRGAVDELIVANYPIDL